MVETAARPATTMTCFDLSEIGREIIHPLKRKDFQPLLHPKARFTDQVRDKPRRSGWGRIARTAQPSYNRIAANNQGSLRQGMPEVTPVEIRAAVAHSAQEPTEATRGRLDAAPERRRNLRHSCRGGCQDTVLTVAVADTLLHGRDPVAALKRWGRCYPDCGFGGMYGYDLSRTVDEIRPDYRFDETCQGTVPEAIVCALEASDYEDAIRNAVSLGGDADTLAAICGAIAEARFGIPGEIARETWRRLPEDMRSVMVELYRRAGATAPWSGAGGAES